VRLASFLRSLRGRQLGGFAFFVGSVSRFAFRDPGLASFNRLRPGLNRSSLSGSSAIALARSSCAFFAALAHSGD
jgi:hypothetical protein